MWSFELRLKQEFIFQKKKTLIAKSIKKHVCIETCVYRKSKTQTFIFTWTPKFQSSGNAVF